MSRELIGTAPAHDLLARPPSRPTALEFAPRSRGAPADPARPRVAPPQRRWVVVAPLVALSVLASVVAAVASSQAQRDADRVRSAAYAVGEPVGIAVVPEAPELRDVRLDVLVVVTGERSLELAAAAVEGGGAISAWVRPVEVPAHAQVRTEVVLRLRCDPAPGGRPGTTRLRLTGASGGSNASGDAVRVDLPLLPSAALACVDGATPGTALELAGGQVPVRDGDALAVRVHGPRGLRLGPVRLPGSEEVLATPALVLGPDPVTLTLEPPSACAPQWQTVGMPTLLLVETTRDGAPAQVQMVAGPALARWLVAVACPAEES